MSTLLIWNATSAWNGWGHAALKTRSPKCYISWRPATLPNFPPKALLHSGEGLAFDEIDDSYMAAPADQSIEVPLNEPLVAMWWKRFQASGEPFETTESNCAFVVARAIAAGQGMTNLSYLQRVRFLAWTPADLVDLAHDINNARSMQERRCCIERKIANGRNRPRPRPRPR